jgi:hypothetical protein
MTRWGEASQATASWPSHCAAGAWCSCRRQPPLINVTDAGARLLPAAVLDDIVDGGMDGGASVAGPPYLRCFPETCSAASLARGEGCAFQLSVGELVGTADLAIQIAMDVCPGSLLPYRLRPIHRHISCRSAWA